MYKGIILKFLVTILLLKTWITSISCSAAVENNDVYPLSELIELNEDNWGGMLNGEWMVEFFAPWCPACKSLAPTWEKFAIDAGKYNVRVAKIDVTKSPSLSGRFFVTALPTIYHVKNGEFRQYRGPRNGDSLLEYVRDKQWQKIEPLSAWKQPNSIHMSVLSWFFKLSHYLKDVNTHLHEEYGLPTWGSYALFAIATIFLGAVLGLCLVCIVDILYPPKKAYRQSFSDKQKSGSGDRLHDVDGENKNLGSGDGIEDIEGDELEDDEQENAVNDDSTSEGEKNSGEDSDDDDDDEENDEEGKAAATTVTDKDKLEKNSNVSSNTEIRERKTKKENSD